MGKQNLIQNGNIELAMKKLSPFAEITEKKLSRENGGAES